jgi:putative selenium metabolism protein SsnA
MGRTVLIKNGLVVTMDGERRVIEGGAIAIDEDKIVKVGREEVISSFSADEALDAQGGIITPGFICSHTHLYGILLRGANIDLPPPTDFTQNLQRIWWPMDQAMNYEDAYASALVASLEFLKTGTTTFADTFSGPNAIEGVLDHIERAVDEVGIRGIIAFEATERRSREEGYRGVEENIRFLKKERKGRVMGMMSLHASFTLTDELIKYAVEKARELKATITLHVSEGRWDLYHNLERYGKRTVERLNDLGLLGRDAVLAHVVHVNEDELNLIRKSGTHVAHNAMSNMLNAVGVSPLKKMLDMGINVSLGNDGYIFDVFENIRSTYLLHKVHHQDPRVISTMDVLEMATIRAAKAYGIDHILGSLEPGKKADLVIIKPRIMPTPLNAGSVYGHLVNTIDGDDVDTVLVDGEVVLRNGEPTKVKVEEVNEKAQRSAANLWERLREVRENIDVLRP